METQFIATVNAQGDRLHAPDKAAVAKALEPFASQEVVVSIEPYDPATKGLRGYYFKVVVEAFRNHLNEERKRTDTNLLPLSKDQTHELMTQAFLGVEEGLGVTTGKSTKGFTQEQLWDYIEECCSYAAQEWGMEIPLPEGR